MNVLLRDTQEFIDGKPTGALGLVLIRYVMRASTGSASGLDVILAWLTLFFPRTDATTSSIWARPMQWK